MILLSVLFNVSRNEKNPHGFSIDSENLKEGLQNETRWDLSGSGFRKKPDQIFIKELNFNYTVCVRIYCQVINVVLPLGEGVAI